MMLARPASTLLLVTVIALAAAVLAIELVTPLGTVEWVLYLAPVALCVFARHAALPLLSAGVCSLLMALGYFASPPGADPGMAALNRALGGATLWIVAVIGFVFIRARLQAQQLLWLQQGAAALGRDTIGQPTIEALSERVLKVLVHYLDAQAAVLYRLDDKGDLVQLAGWGQLAHSAPALLRAGAAGLAGQAARDSAVVGVHDAAGTTLQIGSALMAGVPRHAIAAPLTAEGEIQGVVELGFIDRPADDRVAELLRLCAEPIGVALRSAAYRTRLETLLGETRRQSQELQAQQEELRASNEELEEQSRLLRESQARMELQQTELEQTNVRLEEQSRSLEEQQQAVVAAQERLRQYARELERANQYKSEFLANMSHELRTPLNSSLILAKLLADNKGGNLSDEQVRYAQTIQSSNNELLALINDILDLSKIEAGKAELHAERVQVSSVLDAMERMFRPLAEQRGLRFALERVPGAPASLTTDSQRLQQILKNLLANAIKFTRQGSVTLKLRGGPDGGLSFDVTDTGIGIPAEQQAVIFEAFRQADGTTARKYGGTGLGLSISRELAQLLGGRIEVASEPGRGSTFTLHLPQLLPEVAPASQTLSLAPDLPVTTPAPAPRTPPRAAEGFEDDRERRSRGERLILIVEDDPAFSRILYELVHELGFDALRAPTAGEALALVREHRPVAVLLDAELPDDSGLTVLERLKRDPRTRHVPVHMVSVHDYTETALQLGAIGYTLKPTSREELERAIGRIEARLNRAVRRLLIVEDDAALRQTMVLLLQEKNVEIHSAGTLADAQALLAGQSFDCVVMDLALPDGSGYELLESMAEGGRYAFPPVIVYTGRQITAEEEQRLRRYSKSIIVKGARSPERLLDEVTLFLHSVESELPPERQRMLREVRERDAAFENRRILLAEDDVRNIFALSQILEPLGARLEIARNGVEALAWIDRGETCDLVLMDIMMPEMDGLTAIRELRKRPDRAELPVIALTAKAMPEDRVRCLEAGANDYIAKPIDIDRLLSLCRVWMPR